MDEDQAETDGQTSEVIGGTVGLRGSSQNDEHEQGRQHNLDNQAVHYTIGTGIGTSSGGDDTLAICRADNQSQYSSSQDGADDLEQHVHATVLSLHAACQETAKGDGWVDMATRDATDCVSHGYDCQTKGHGRAND